MSSAQSSSENGAVRFATTHWSVVLAARGQAAPRAREALAELCTAYWYPLYAYIRHQGHDAEAARDLTQEFFSKLLEKNILDMVDRQRGRFRAFLMTSCRHFLANERDRSRALKRGGGRVLSLDFLTAATRYHVDPGHDLTPERLFERRWALTLLDQVLQRLRQSATDPALFDRLKPFLIRECSDSYRDASESTGMTEGALKVAVHRLRRQYRELLREEIVRTVEDPSQVEDEIRALFAAFG